MRDIVLVLFILLGLAATLRYPFAGVLLWTWFTLMNPHQDAFGFATTAPLNLIIAVVTVGSLAASGQLKMPSRQFIFWMIVIFLIWMTITTPFSQAPEISWPLWNNYWKIFALGILIAATATDKVRVQALIWIVVISLFYYGVKGGVFVFMTGGVYRVQGPPGTIIGDNNQLAVALLMTLPLANYLRVHSARREVRTILLAAMVLTVVAIIGTYSRGAIIGLAALMLAGWFRVRGKFVYLIVAMLVMVPILYFMPQDFYDRLDTMNSLSTDESFQGRVQAWQVAIFCAFDHIPLGVGFGSAQTAAVFKTYFPDSQPHAAHSIYFQVLGDLGFIGLGIYLSLIAGAFLKTFAINREAKRKPEFRWIQDLVSMIQVSLFVFCVAGAGLSMAYYDLFVILICLLIPLSQILTGKKAGQSRFKMTEFADSHLEGQNL